MQGDSVTVHPVYVHLTQLYALKAMDSIIHNVVARNKIGQLCVVITDKKQPQFAVKLLSPTESKYVT